MENNGLIRITVGGDTAFVATETASPKSKHRSCATNKVRRPKDPKPKEWLASELSKQKIADYKPFNLLMVKVSGAVYMLVGVNLLVQDVITRWLKNFNYGFDYTKELEDQIISDLSHDYVQGLTLLGGEPFLNTQVCLPLVERIRKEYGTSKDIWSWSGYTFEELLLDSKDKLELLSKIDILVDGRFQEGLKDLTLQFRGSSNQRIIDVQRSLAAGEVVIWDKLER